MEVNRKRMGKEKMMTMAAKAAVSRARTKYTVTCSTHFQRDHMYENLLIVLLFSCLFSSHSLSLVFSKRTKIDDKY